MLDKLATNQNRNDELPNIELAEELIKTENQNGINEIVNGLKAKDKRIANDCIKVLYEIGEKRPDLIASYYEQFLELLVSKNNRLVWGSMTALSQIVELESRNIFKQADKIVFAFHHGSVITVDNGVSVLAKLCKQDLKYEEHLFPILMQHLQECRSKEVGQHAERIAICIHENNQRQFVEVLESRVEGLPAPQQKRVRKLLKQIYNI
ncbi:hypothetical protein [Lysinibacillus piscis]|uniref:HEAT repeat domain-containing protein n=1 Tax=Lysinibacillus piscis TaxID=2518931 RepID=A0ABQ5NPJ7_9BACI|nr:hypothetical protein [Lysinibacillus sp. KH24]GLC90270.1 hypothetical protein LYSBPC_33970 [Lysinibacillus sp. KH24]